MSDIIILNDYQFEDLIFSELELFQQFLITDTPDIDDDEYKVTYTPNLLVYSHEYLNCIYKFDTLDVESNCYLDDGEIIFSSKQNKWLYFNINNKNIKIQDYGIVYTDYFNYNLFEKIDTLISECNDQAYYKKNYRYIKDSNLFEFYLLIPFDNGYLLYIIKDDIASYSWNTTNDIYVINKEVNGIMRISEISNFQILDSITKDLKGSKDFDYYMNTIIPLHRITYKNFDKHEITMYELFNEIEKKEIRRFFKPIYENKEYEFKSYLKNIFYNKDYHLSGLMNYVYNSKLDRETLICERRKADAVYKYTFGISLINIYTGEICKDCSLTDIEYRDAEGLIYNSRMVRMSTFYTLLDGIYVESNSSEVTQLRQRCQLLRKLEGEL